MNERNIHEEFKSNIRIIFNTKFKKFVKEFKFEDIFYKKTYKN